MSTFDRLKKLSAELEAHGYSLFITHIGAIDRWEIQCAFFAVNEPTFEGAVWAADREMRRR